MTVSVYPAEVLPNPPKLAYGMRKLKSTYSGHCIDVTNTSNASLSIDFVGDAVNTSVLNSHIGSDPTLSPGRVTKWYDQMHTGLYNLTQNLSRAPAIGSLSIGGNPSIVFEGGSKSGAIFGLDSPTITSLGFTPLQYTFYVVMQASSSMYRNQASTPGVAVGTVISMDGNFGSCITQVIQNGGTDTSNGPGRGTFTVRDNFYIDVTPTDWMIESDPIVLAASTGATSTNIWQNESVRTQAVQSPIVYPINNLYLGRRSDSVVGGVSQCGDFQIVAFMAYTEQHTAKQRALVSASLYSCFGVDPTESRYNKSNVIMIGDSIPAGYVTLGIYGMLPRLREMLPNVRFGNFCVPGEQTTFDVGTPTYAYMLGGFPDTVLPQLTYSKKKNVLVMMGPGNDYARVIPADPNVVYAARVSMTQQALAAGVDKVFICTLPPRAVSYQPSLVAENVLIRAGAVANNYTVIEIANDPQMSVPYPGPMYADSGHMTAAGHQRCATIMYPQIAAAVA